MSSLNDLIVSAISGVSDEVESDIEKTAFSVEPTEYVDNDIEKVAAALEYVGNKGIETFIEKEAAHAGQHPDVTASHVSGENPAMAPGYGKAEDGSHSKALASNESAINFTPQERNKMIDPTLKSLLANANSSSIHSAKGGQMGKTKVAAETKELLRQAIALKMAEKSGGQL